MQPLNANAATREATIADLMSTGVPAWAKDYRLSPQPDGRVFLIADVEGCTVFVQPKAWQSLRFGARQPETATMINGFNFGVNVGELQATGAGGVLSTNDPTFRPEPLGEGVGQCRQPDPIPVASGVDGIDPAVIVGAGLLVLALFVGLVVFLFRRGR